MNCLLQSNPRAKITIYKCFEKNFQHGDEEIKAHGIRQVERQNSFFLENAYPLTSARNLQNNVRNTAATQKDALQDFSL